MRSQLQRQIAGVYEITLPLYGALRIVRDGRRGWSARTRLGFVVAEADTLRDVLDQLDRATREDA